MKRRSASPQTEEQVDGARVGDVVVSQHHVVLHLFALVEEPLLAHLHPLPALHPGLEVAHSLVGFDVVGAGLAPLVPEGHLDGGPVGDQQGDPGAGVHSVEGERLGVVAQRAPLAVVHRQTLLVTSHPRFLLDAVLQRAHRVHRVHRQGDGGPVQHDDPQVHDEDSLQERVSTLAITGGQRAER